MDLSYSEHELQAKFEAEKLRTVILPLEEEILELKKKLEEYAVKETKWQDSCSSIPVSLMSTHILLPYRFLPLVFNILVKGLNILGIALL